MEMFQFLRRFLETEDTKVMFLMFLICIAMIIDFLSGTIAAKLNSDIEFKSNIGIYGIIRKIASVVLLLFFIPLSILIPGGAGTALLYVLYLGYLFMEIQSIFENYKKFGNDVTLFEKFMKHFNKKDDGE